MSSTNRSQAREEHIADYYITPVEEIQNFLSHFLNDIDKPLSEYKILEPCAGGDNNHPMSYKEALFPWNDVIDTIDIRADSRAALIADYLQTDCKGKYSMIITNPPYNKAIEIIEKALEDITMGGYVIMLLRLNFFGSKARKPFWEKNMPIYCYVHHKRMSFTGKGMDSIEYCHMVWQKGTQPEFTKLKVI